MKIYTRGGDRGETGLMGGLRVPKNHPCVEACGDLDEANSVIGLALSGGSEAELAEILMGIQNDLFVVGAKVAGCLSERSLPAIAAQRVAELEAIIDRFQNELPPLTAFILPGGGNMGALLHFARAVCRRAERRVVAVSVRDDLVQSLERELVYLNRVADLLFVLARIANANEGKTETPWRVERHA